MATETEESNITLRESGGGELTQTESVQEAQNYKCETRRKWPFRSIGSRSLLLVLTWQFIIQCLLSTTRNRMHYLISDGAKDLRWIKGETLLGVATLSISCPIASILAEVAFGRYKLVSFSLKAMWTISVFTCIVSIMPRVSTPN